MQETICDVYWEGPFACDKRALLWNPSHVLYAIYGTHHMYGPNVLLYIGMTETTVADRLAEHTWIRDEYDPVTIKIASIGVHSSPVSNPGGRLGIGCPTTTCTRAQPLRSFARLKVYSYMHINLHTTPWEK